LLTTWVIPDAGRPTRLIGIAVGDDRSPGILAQNEYDW
jgi:hypothetical protein